MTLLEAIARQEGFYVDGSRAHRNNNPGNIEYGPFAKEHGSIGIEPAALSHDKPRFAVFSSPEAGFAALGALLHERYSGMTLEAALNEYAPPVENDTNVYLAHVCEWCGARPTDLIDPYLNGS